MSFKFFFIVFGLLVFSLTTPSPKAQGNICDLKMSAAGINGRIDKGLLQSFSQMESGDSIYFEMQIWGKEQYKKALSELREKNIHIMRLRKNRSGGYIAIRENIKGYISFALNLDGVQSANTVNAGNDLLARKNRTADQKMNSSLEAWNKIPVSSNKTVKLYLISVWNKEVFNNFINKLKADHGLNTEVTNIYFNSFQPMGFIGVQGTKKNLIELLEKYPEIDRAQIEK